MKTMAAQDEKILAVPVSKLTKMYDSVHDIGDMQEIQVEAGQAHLHPLQGSRARQMAKISHVGGYEDAKKGDPRFHRDGPARQIRRDPSWPSGVAD